LSNSGRRSDLVVAMKVKKKERGTREGKTAKEAAMGAAERIS
jgi:hypothetical protein